MSAVLKSCMQVLGALIGAFGIAEFWQAHKHFSNRDWAGFAFVIALATYSLSIGILSLAKLSPSITRQLLAIALFWVWLVGHGMVRMFPLNKSMSNNLSLAWLVLVIWSYRRLWRYCVAGIYGEKTEQVEQGQSASTLPVEQIPDP